ncbi:MAG: Cdc6/Cdc18 family protein [Promethearchaeota archaeon]
MKINYLEQQFFTHNLFNHEEFLEVNYVPDEILHRNQELIMLSKIFIKIIEQPFLVSRKVMIQGDVGIGKTAIIKTFSKMLLLSSKNRNLNIKYIHINCRIERTNYKILQKILQGLSFPIPKRGFSPQELLTILYNFLQTNKIYLLLTLDELNFLQKSEFDLIYSLTRLTETSTDEKNYISLITIIRNLSILRNLDDSTISTLQGNILRLKKYTKKQIFDILQQRINLALKVGVFPENLINLITDEIVSTGDLRKAFNIIRNATKMAESHNHSQVYVNDVHEALKDLISSIQDDTLSILNSHQIFLLQAITFSLLEKKENSISIQDFYEEYKNTCFNLSLSPLKTTQIWQNLQTLKNYNLIEIENVSKNIKGRKSFFSVKDIPLKRLNLELKKKMKKFLQN